MRCKSCLMPSTRPDTAFVDGECSACISYRKRDEVDWKLREDELCKILETAPPWQDYDCIVASSGGKDSTWQVLKLLELGARPLVVTATTCMLTEIGRKNIDNLTRYADTIEVTPDPKVRAKLNRWGLELVGDCSWPEHVSIFCAPFQVAAQQDIPLIFYGECPQEAYGGPLGSDEARTMTRRWISEFGGFLGLRPNDFIGIENITESDMAPYVLPSEEHMAKTQAYFLGQFLRWDSNRNMQEARDAGMVAVQPSRVNWFIGENMDCALTGVHDFLGALKFGYGRACAQVSIDIRAGRLTREQGWEIILERDCQLPETYMGVPMDTILERLELTWDQFWTICDQFTNWELYNLSEGRVPILKEFAALESAI